MPGSLLGDGGPERDEIRSCLGGEQNPASTRACRRDDAKAVRVTRKTAALAAVAVLVLVALGRSVVGKTAGL